MSLNARVRRLEGTPGIWEFEIVDEGGTVVDRGATLGESACRELARRAVRRAENSEWHDLD